MTYTEAHKKSNKKWDAANLDRISVTLPKGQKEVIKAHVQEKTGETVNKFVQRAINETLERDNSDK